MLKADQIPDEVVEAAARAIYKAWCAFHGVTDTSMPWEEIGGSMRRQACIAEARASITAALSAWPNATTTSWFENGVRKAVLNIPLPLESNNAEG